MKEIDWYLNLTSVIPENLSSLVRRANPAKVNLIVFRFLNEFLETFTSLRSSVNGKSSFKDSLFQPL